jgi:hypothetical protein
MDRLEAQQHLNHCIAVSLRAPSPARPFRRWCEHLLVHPDAHIAPLNQARVGLGPVLDPVAPLGRAGQRAGFKCAWGDRYG